MYQAIVFLPLLGFLVAGLISLAGAHARHPGGGGGDHAQGAAHDDHAHAASAAHDDHHAPAQPPAAGSREAELVTTALLFTSMALSWIAFAYVGLGHHETRVV